MNNQDVLTLGILAHTLPEIVIIEKLHIAIQKYKAGFATNDKKVMEEMLFEIQLASTLLVIKQDCDSPFDFLQQVESLERAEKLFNPNKN